MQPITIFTMKRKMHPSIMGDKVMNNKKSEKPHKMYKSIISGLQEIIDDFTVQTKHNKTELDSLLFHDDVPLPTEDSLVNTIQEDSGSDKAQG